MKRRSLMVLALVPTLILGIVIVFAHRFFAVNEPVGGDVLVVEGWLDRASLREVKELVERDHYRRVYTTGTIRPVSYHLKAGEAVEGVLRKPVEGRVRLVAAGLPGSTLVLIMDRDTLFRIALTGDPKVYEATLAHPSRLFRFVDIDPPLADVDRAWMGGARFEKEELHHLAKDMFLVAADGRSRPTGPTWAHQAANILEELGLPREIIVPRPTYGKPDGRTWTTARNFVDFAANTGIDRFDVVTLGVHARRTRGLYRRAARTIPGAADMEIGIIGLPDPSCRPNDWWLHASGWVTVLKEIAGAHQPYATE